MLTLQRRLSDPSANIAKFARGGWRTRERDADKSRSENEGLDSLVDGITEVEAGDLRDGGYPSSPLSMLSMRSFVYSRRSVVVVGSLRRSGAADRGRA